MRRLSCSVRVEFSSHLRSALLIGTGARWKPSLTGDRLRFGILGPLLVDDSEGPVSVPGGRQRVLLSALLLRTGQPLSAEALAEVVWDGSPPPGATDTLRTHVMRLRRVLGARAGKRLVTRSPGYLLDASEDEVDLLRFGRLCRDGSIAVRAGSWPQASQILAEALGLWRGPALADVPSQLLHRDEVPSLDQLRLQAQEWRIDADLHLSRHAELVPELKSLAAEYPLRERFHAQLMLTLYRCYRQAEALAAYQRVRQVLAEELGAEPGNELQRLHQQILTADPALELPRMAVPEAALPEHATRPAADRSGAPRQLPGPVPQFTGRDTELATLTRVLEQAARARPATVVISAIGGTAGVGKTALALHWAHQVAGQFPDGQLYVNLRGYDPGQPVTAADALAGLLRALGVDGQDIPAELDERAARYRSLLAGKQALIVLDNAGNVGQVRPLLPGTAGCAVVVTSRDSLAGLVARDGAARLELDLLPLRDAVDLLRQLIGGRAGADPPAVEELAAQCCRLPLALRVAAELAAARPGAPLHDLVAELSDQRRRLNLLDAGGDARTAVRAVFSWSYDHLDVATARAFRLAGLHPGPEFDRHAIAAITGTTPNQARHVLDVLTRGHLIQPAGLGRYVMHDLLRAYARELAASTDGKQDEQRGLTRLFDYYLSAAASAMDILFPAEAHRRPRIAATAAVVTELRGEADARAWLDTERPNLVAMVAHCADHGWPRQATNLARTLFRYLMDGSHLPEAQTIYGHAMQAARTSGDMAAEARMLSGLGGIGMMKGRFRDATGHYQAALERYRQCGDRAGEAGALQNLGAVVLHQHDHQSAACYYREAVTAYEDAGDSLGAARALADLAAAETELGSYDQASEYLQRALPVIRDAKDQRGEARALVWIGELGVRRGQLSQAAAFFEQALTIWRRVDNPTGVAQQLRSLGEISLRQAEYQRAISYLRRALSLFRDTGQQHGEIVALRNLAEALHGVGQPAAARAELAAALRLASETGTTYEEASAHRDLAESHHLAGEDDQARRHWQQALALYSQLGVPEAEEIRARLAAAGGHALAD
jgi:DNA-binding SARP family transcriptional activator